PVAEGGETMLQLVEVDRHDGDAAVGKLDGIDVVVADAASLVGKRQKVRIERVLDGVAYGTLVRKTKPVPEPLTAEGEAEKPTRKPPAGRGATAETAEEPAETEEVAEVELVEPEADVEAVEAEEAAIEAAEAGEVEEAATQKKKTRRGSRGGR